MSRCKAKTEVYSRIVGYFRPVQQWNIGKKQEYFSRKNFNIDKPGDAPLEFPIADDAAAAEQSVTASAN